jgi:hypothetical protein
MEKVERRVRAPKSSCGAWCMTWTPSLEITGASSAARAASNGLDLKKADYVTGQQSMQSVGCRFQHGRLNADGTDDATMATHTSIEGSSSRVPFSTPTTT